MNIEGKKLLNSKFLVQYSIFVLNLLESLPAVSVAGTIP
jgi:hypothetical protein